MLRKLQRTMTMMMIAMMTAMVMTLQSNPCPQALQGWHVKVKRFFFFLLHLKKKNFSCSLLQRILQLVPLIIHVESQQRWK